MQKEDGVCLVILSRIATRIRIKNSSLTTHINLMTRDSFTLNDTIKTAKFQPPSTRLKFY